MDSFEVQEQLQLVLRTIARAQKQLSKLDGMEHYIEQLDDLGASIEQEVEELLTFEE